MAYNFQLHHVPYALNAVLRWREFKVEWLHTRLRLSAEAIHNVHFSGEVKIWDVLLPSSGSGSAHASWTNTNAFTDHLLRSCCQDYGQWEEGAVLAKDASQDVADLVEEVYLRLQHVARVAVATWRGCADRLLALTPRLLDELRSPKPVGDSVGSIVRGGG